MNGKRYLMIVHHKETGLCGNGWMKRRITFLKSVTKDVGRGMVNKVNGSKSASRIDPTEILYWEGTNDKRQGKKNKRIQ
jgi:hypothetical protein